MASHVGRNTGNPDLSGEEGGDRHGRGFLLKSLEGPDCAVPPSVVRGPDQLWAREVMSAEHCRVPGMVLGSQLT